jgi:PAS domain-containing protein
MLHRRLSELIGMIYDCAIEPNRWPATLAEICQSVGCKSGFILLVDLEQSRHKFVHSWGLSPEWQKRYFAFSDMLTGFYSLAFSRRYHLDGEPLIMSNFQALMGSNGRRIYEDLRRTLDITDVMQTVVLREARRIALLTTNRHQGGGTLMDQDAATIRLFVPHVRRAVKIIDLLDVKKIEADTLAATLDTFAAGVVVVGEKGRILHANRSARRMLSAREPIAAIDGVLSVRNATANKEIIDLFARAASGDCLEQFETAALFFGWLIADVSRVSEAKPIVGGARTLMMQWLPLIDPLCIAEDPECGYGRPAGFVS